MPDANDAISRLAWHYENPVAEALRAHRAGVPVVGLTSNTIPWELVSAAGLFPFVFRPTRQTTVMADEFMEEGVFAPRIRAIFDGVVSGEWSFLRAILIPRTSEQEYKLFLYLREVVRERGQLEMPPVYLYDLLHSRSTESYGYGLERTKQLASQLERIAGRPIRSKELREAIVQSNAARAAARRLLQLRRDRPRLKGVDALPLIGAYWLIDRSDYAIQATAAAEILGRREPARGVRLMIKGASLDHPMLHQAIESRGAIVVAEDDWWGTRSAGGDVGENEDMLKAIFEKYYLDTASPRVFPPDAADQWFKGAARDGVDGVLFYLPQDDYIVGWDYPRHKKWLDQIGIPSAVVRGEARTGEFSSASHESIDRLVLQAGREH
jgi:benzoyl-CoA reductase/2-hydroxyglutaryl-CoA dehydratase subunit BcrC/BadD/HgdB